MGGVSVAGLVHLLADGSLAPGFHPPAISGIMALAVADGRLYVGGLTEARRGGHWSTPVVLSLDAATGAVDRKFSVRLESFPLPSPSIPSIPPPPGAAACEVDELPFPERPPPPHVVSALLVSGSRVFLGGVFKKVNGVARVGLAAVDADSGELDAGFDPARAPGRVSGVATSLALAGGHLYAAGGFHGANGTDGAVALDPQTGALDPAFVVRGPAAVGAMVSAGERLYLAGETRARRQLIAEVDSSSGHRLASFALDGFPSTMVLDGGTLFVGTAFTHRAAAYLRAYALDSGRLLSTFDPRVDGVVNAITPWRGSLFIGGQFASAGGQRASGLAALDVRTGALDPRFRPDGWLDVRGLAASRSGLYVAGALVLHARPRPGYGLPYVVRHGLVGVIELDPRTGRRDARFKPSGKYGDGASIALEGSRLYAIDNLAGLIALNPRTGRPERSFAPAFRHVGGFAATPTDIYAADPTDTRIVAMRTRDGARDPRFKPHLRYDINQGGILAIAVHGRRLYASGALLPLGQRHLAPIIALRLPAGQHARGFHSPPLEPNFLQPLGSLLLASPGNGENGLVALGLRSGRRVSFAQIQLAQADRGVCSVERIGHRIYLGGDFSRVDGQLSPNLAVVNAR
jgi:hypothetical protein